jgi:Na+-transporting NADH:ubiquinone oxidoreductase subunit NqrF
MLADVVGGDPASYTYLVAGPPGMTEGVVGELNEAGILEDRILSDGFSGY